MVTKFFSIASIKLSLRYDPGAYKILMDSALDAFASRPFETPDILFRVDTSSPFPSLDSHRKIFTTNPEGLWTIFEDTEKRNYLISLQNVENDEKPYKIVLADRKFTDFIIYSKPARNNLLVPLEYPLDELIVSGHINLNKIGILLHSACISLGGRGHLFSGVSGSGKSSISEIWQKDSDTEVLTDERVIIRVIEDNLWAFGTPWHGTAGINKNMGVPIEKIFFIKHGKENRATPISTTDAANRLMVRCFPTFWNREGMQFAVDFCIRIAKDKKCFELEFVNDLTVIDYVKRLDYEEG